MHKYSASILNIKQPHGWLRIQAPAYKLHLYRDFFLKYLEIKGSLYLECTWLNYKVQILKTEWQNHDNGQCLNVK